MTLCHMHSSVSFNGFLVHCRGNVLLLCLQCTLLESWGFRYLILWTNADVKPWRSIRRRKPQKSAGYSEITDLQYSETCTTRNVDIIEACLELETYGSENMEPRTSELQVPVWNGACPQRKNFSPFPFRCRQGSIYQYYVWTLSNCQISGGTFDIQSVRVVGCCHNRVIYCFFNHLLWPQFQIFLAGVLVTGLVFKSS
jgi:hypothetical protein